MPYHRCSSLPLVATIPIEVLLSLATGYSSLPLVATIPIKVLLFLAKGCSSLPLVATIPIEVLPSLAMVLLSSFSWFWCCHPLQ